MSEPYQALGTVYDRWTGENDFDKWSSFIDHRVGGAAASATVLDLFCGTGAITRRLQDAGYDVSGVDGSLQMLERARANTRPGTVLTLAQLPGADIAGQYDAVIATFDSVNYMAGDGELSELFTLARRLLRPGGTFIFDVNTRHKIEDVLGSSHYGDDLGDFAYIWRNRYDAATHRIDFLITLFIEGGEGFARFEEHHVQRWFSDSDIRDLARGHGFSAIEVFDDYTDRTVTEGTLRETWVLG